MTGLGLVIMKEIQGKEHLHRYRFKSHLPFLALSVDGDLERPLEVSLLRPPLNSRLTKVLERCRVLFSSGSFAFCFFSFFCLISADTDATVVYNRHLLKSCDYELSCLTCHGDLALRPADGSARPAQGQQHGRLRRLTPPLALLPTDQGVSEQGGAAQAAGGVCRQDVGLDGRLRPLRLRPGQKKHRQVVFRFVQV